jgi:hypothetical protein
MDEEYYEECYTAISIFNIKEKLKHYVFNDYYTKLIKHLLEKELITTDDVNKIKANFYTFVNDI